MSLSARESYYRRTLGIHRSYWGPTQAAKAASSARADVLAHRLPWVSFKLPGSWASMAAGSHDAWVLDVIKRLNAVPGPVWIAFHHEPEGARSQQNVNDWRRMQAHLLPMVHAHSDNVATTIILMGWHQVYGTDSSLKLSNLWPGNVVDVLGMDPYNFYGQMSQGRRLYSQTDMRPYFRVFNAWATAHHAHWGMAETGIRDDAFYNRPSWLLSTWRSMLAYHGIAMSYFDSTLNTSGNSWALEPTSKRAQWASVLSHTARICR